MVTGGLMASFTKMWISGLGRGWTVVELRGRGTLAVGEGGWETLGDGSGER